jgi:hypothetical protein
LIQNGLEGMTVQRTGLAFVKHFKPESRLGGRLLYAFNLTMLLAKAFLDRVVATDRRLPTPQFSSLVKPVQEKS